MSICANLSSRKAINLHLDITIRKTNSYLETLANLIILKFYSIPSLHFIIDFSDPYLTILYILIKIWEIGIM